jgi:hypothetical protein
MALEPENAAKGPWKDVKLISVPDYVRTLHIPGDFNWRKAVHTILLHFKLPFLLPVADLAVPQSSEEQPDVFGPVGGSPFVYALLRDALSPLHMYGIGATRHN